tara:strand:+ start:514 stop:771 length:258 start_codon:yes stop_codon:yes gene_type:complete
MAKNTLKPNGISHTVMPEDPASNYNEWMEHITASSIERDADLFKKKFDVLWAWTYFEDAGAASDFKKEYDALWADFKKQIQNHAK